MVGALLLRFRFDPGTSLKLTIVALIINLLLTVH